MTSESATDARPKRTWTPARRAADEARRERRGRAEPSTTRGDVELIAEEVIGEAVDNIVTLAGFAMPIAPYTAVTIMGVPEPDTRPEENRWLVRSRAVMAGNILLEHAKRNPRILQAVARFNLLFKNVELVEVVGSVVAAGAVDAKLVPPDATIALPGGAEMLLLAPAIGDTLEYMALQQGQEPQPVLRVEKRADRGAAADPAAGSAELTPEQRAEARRTRDRLKVRDEAISNGHPDPGPDPTLRREGQTVIGGGVEDT